jgi:hypothetical protein
MDSTAVAPPKKSRLPFKRAQRKPSPPPQEIQQKDDLDSDDDLEFFRRSKELFPGVLKETEKRAKTKARKSSDAELRDSSEERTLKKRRTLSVGSSDDSELARGPRSGSSLKRKYEI